MSAVTTVRETALDLPLFWRGKVRDTYELGDNLLMVATDRISAYDAVLPTGIPDKGRVLTQLSKYWFGLTGDTVSNHFITDDLSGIPGLDAGQRALIDGRAMVVRRARRLDIECVVRGYLAGSGWADYRASGEVCGVRLPAGLTESERLPEPIFTPASKSDTGHDQNITLDEMQAMVGQELSEAMRSASMALYEYAAAHAATRGLILCDTKFEFGLVDGRLCLIDEALTPDSSRYWDAELYRPGVAQPSFDKQFVRDYLAGLDWDRNPPAPALPDDVVQGTRDRYLEAYRRVTGRDLPAEGRAV
ncbi:MAG: phosphoribosylaminoimidazolesuccinocarboxamide synthase [Candidatus Dormibacteria bacterium]